MPITNDALVASLGFVQSQTTYVEAQVNQTIYPGIQYPDLIPVDTSAPEMATTVTYYGGDKFGSADWINGNADDIPLAGTLRQQFQTAVYTAGIGYGWGWEEVERARMLGTSLQADDAMAAREAYENFVDNIALWGDTTKSFQGFLTNSGVTPGSAVTGAWGGGVTTTDEVLGDINAAIIASATATLQTAMADSLLLPVAKLQYLASTPRSSTSDTTLLEFIQRTNVYTATTGRPLFIRGVRGLETAGAGSTNRMVTYRRSPQVVKLHIPMTHRFLPVHRTGVLNYVVPGVFRLGGVDIRRPKEVQYTDGI